DALAAELGALAHEVDPVVEDTHAFGDVRLSASVPGRCDDPPVSVHAFDRVAGDEHAGDPAPRRVAQLLEPDADAMLVDASLAGPDRVAGHSDTLDAIAHGAVDGEL